MYKTMRISKNSIARYELEVMQKGVCGSAVPLHFAEEKDLYLVKTDISGLESMDRWFRADRSYAFDAYRRLLRFMRSLALSLSDAEKYLIPPQHLSLEPEDIYVRDEKLLLMPSGEEGTPLEERTGRLLDSIERRYPQTHASYLSDRLPECFDAEALLRLLTGMELDIIGR